MNELLVGPVDGHSATFMAMNPIGRHLLFVDRLCQVPLVDYVVTTQHSIEFMPGAIPQLNADGSRPTIHLVHL